MAIAENFVLNKKEYLQEKYLIGFFKIHNFWYLILTYKNSR
jgi:hypothetical protein